MALSIVVVIREDPLKTHRAVEALRIALGLSAGKNPLTIALLDRAPLLISEDTEDIVDGDILEKYLPSLKQLEIPFVVSSGACSEFSFASGFITRELPPPEIAALIAESDRVLVF
ncbi:MAG: DsrE family protein [Nitrospirae bacterium]|nr:DsrE family protein [Nitrospirota bacterium]